MEKQKGKTKAERNRKQKIEKQIRRTERRDEKQFLKRLMWIDPDFQIEYGN